MNPEKRLLILTPAVLPSVTGNAMTVERWRRSLARREYRVQSLATERSNVTDLLFQLKHFRPHLIHVHHAFRAGSLLLHPPVVSEWTDIPLVASPAGTDINLDIRAPEKRETVFRILQKARVIIAQGRETADQLTELLPDLADRIALVPKSCFWLGNESYDLRTAARCGPANVLFFHPAGIRPVKGNLECLTAMRKVHALRPNVRVVFAGPSLDAHYAARFEEEAARFSSFARWLSSIPPEAMRTSYEAADVVLNTSFSEGLSNSVLEAITAERPVLASDIPGNRLPVLGENGGPPAGCLFDPLDEEDFIRKAVTLVDNRRMREQLCLSARWRALQWPTPDAEADGLISAYNRALGSIA